MTTQPRCNLTGEHVFPTATEPPRNMPCVECGTTYGELLGLTPVRRGFCAHCRSPVDDHEGVVSGAMKCPPSFIEKEAAG